MRLHPDIAEVTRNLVELGLHGVIRGDAIHVDGGERSAVVWPLGPERYWYAGSERVEIWSDCLWPWHTAEDVRAWLERGEIVYRDGPGRRR